MAPGLIPRVHLHTPTRGSNWLPRTVVGVQVILSLAPFLSSIVLFFVQVTSRLSVGDWHRAVYALGNSLIFALGTSMVAVLAAAALVIFADCMTEAALFSLLSLMLPGEFVALGMDRFVKLVSPASWYTLKNIGFVIAIVGYIFPYICACLILSKLSRAGSESLALSELSPSPLAKASLLAFIHRSDLILAGLVGVNMALCEATRTRLLSDDLFGLGPQFFGPLVIDAFMARGLEQVYFFLSYLIAGTVLVTTLIVFRRAAAR